MVLLASRPIVTCVPRRGWVRAAPSWAVTLMPNTAHARSGSVDLVSELEVAVLREAHVRVDGRLHALLGLFGQRATAVLGDRRDHGALLGGGLVLDEDLDRQ